MSEDINKSIDSIREELEIIDLKTVELDLSLYYNIDLKKIRNNKSVIEARKKYAKTLAHAIFDCKHSNSK